VSNLFPSPAGLANRARHTGPTAASEPLAETGWTTNCAAGLRGPNIGWATE
jgi:hypothetical protein